MTNIVQIVSLITVRDELLKYWQTVIFAAFASLLLSPAAQAEDDGMEFSITPDPTRRMSNKMLRGIDYVDAEGEITEGAAGRLAAFVQREGIRDAKVFFNSPGGLARRRRQTRKADPRPRF